jgi:hypothetical protein
MEDQQLTEFCKLTADTLPDGKMLFIKKKKYFF